MTPVHRWLLPNGLTVLYRQSDGVPLAAATLLLRTGSIYESPQQAGLANLTTDLLLQGTKRRTARVLAENIESMGASLGAQASDDYTEMGFVAPVTLLNQILDISADVLISPSFSEFELNKERANVLASLNSRKDVLFNFAYDAFNKGLFGKTHPYGRPMEGHSQTVERIKRQDLIAWHREHFHPDRAVFSMIASLPFPQAKKIIERYLNPWKKRVAFQTPDAHAPKPLSKNEHQLLKSKFEQAYVMTGVSAPGVLDSDYLTLKVLNTLLGGGMSSRLFLRLREELGLAYEVSSFFPTHWMGSEWVIYLGLPQNKVSLAKRELEKILSALMKHAPHPEEVKQAIAMIKGSYLMERQTRRRQAWYMAWWELLGKGYEYDRYFLKALDKITPTHVGELAQRLLKQPRVTVEVASR